MNIFDAIVLGVVEGITEFLPISSTGHLAVVADWLGVADLNFLPSFMIAVQVGAIMAVVVMYIKSLATSPGLWLRLFIGIIPTAIIGVTLYSFIRPLLDNVIVVGVALIVGGIFMIVVENVVSKRKPIEENVEPDKYPTVYQSFMIGVYQVISFIPGVSRSAVTIMGGLIHRVPRKTVVEFSFLLSVPTMIAAMGYDVLRSSQTFTADNWYVMAIGGIVAFFVAIVIIRWLLRFIKKYSFKGFGWYRIVAGIIFFFIMFI
ncbi:MAG: undecaprenyl-diphosphate phosphatase [Candidatus Nomurabacteria bacterium]|nr:undecaprenyl-diphosphate phosphatase [Candidatus Nomurabacteria bacterium]